MNLPFTKMQALGNDFVVLDFTKKPSNQATEITTQLAARIADRHFGVGCDQILIVEPSPAKEIDFRYRILNADGSEVGQCGNGARCFAQFVRSKGLSTKSTISVETISGIMHLSLDDTTGLVQVDMGAPRLAASDIPLSLPTANRYTLQLDSGELEFGAVSMGNPHAVINVDDVATAPVAELGKQLQAHVAFAQSVNVGFMQILSAKHIALRVFERGVGETLACGSGACAAVVVGIRMGLLDQEVSVSLSGGDLTVSWQGEGHSVMMCGPATSVFEGSIVL
jgi:diaminopimelate epimerase